MNSGLATFAFLMIVLGAVAGFYPISIIGVFLLIAALLVPSRKLPSRPQPAPSETRRTTTPPQPYVPPVAKRPEPESQPQPQTPQPRHVVNMVQPATATPVLFPTTMFPFINPVTPAQQPQEPRPQQEKGESKDEIIELAAIAVFLRLLSR